MAAGSEALVLKVSADTSEVASGLAPMTAALDRIADEADAAEKELRTLSDVDIDVSGITKMEHALDNLEDEVDATRDAMQDLSGTEVKLKLKDEAIERARDRIKELRDQIAKEVVLGVSTKDSERELSNLQSAVKKLTDTPAVMDVDVDIDDEELAGIESLREGALGMGEALGEAGQGMQSFTNIGREAVPLLADLNQTMIALRLEAAAAGRSMGALGTATSRVTSFMAGPWGLAIAAGVGLAAAFASSSDDAADATDDWTTSLDYATGALDKNNRSVVANELAKRNLLPTIEAWGLSTRDVVSMMLGEEDAAQRVNAALDETERALRDAAEANPDPLFKPPEQSAISKLQDFRAELSGVDDAVIAGAVDSALLKRAIGETATAASSAGGALATMSGGVSHNAEVWADFGEQVEDARSELDDIIDSIDILNGRFATAREATANYEQALDDANEAIKENGKAVTKGGAAFKTSTQAGRDNEKALIDMAKAADDMTRARLADADASGESTSEIMADYESQRKSLYETARRMGLSETAAKEYVDSLLKTPKEVKSDIKLTGYDKAKAQKDELAKDQTAVVNLVLNQDKFMRDVRRGIAGARAEFSGALDAFPSSRSAAPPPAAAQQPSPGLTLLQPRLYLDSRPIRAALRNDVTSTVAAQLAHTRRRGRL